MSDQERIKKKILQINSKRWWGDDFDIRFYLISKINRISQKTILDVGGGIGIISSEIPSDNFKINLDTSLEDLRICKKKFDGIHIICASMEYLPFRSESFDVIICSNLLEVGKEMDLKNKKMFQENNIDDFPTADNTIDEIHSVLNKSGILYITTPNNSYYNTTKLTYKELQNVIKKKFLNFKIYFYNTHKKYGKSRKTNFANILPKLKSKVQNPDKIIKNLIHDTSSDKYSVAFFVEIRKN